MKFVHSSIAFILQAVLFVAYADKNADIIGQSFYLKDKDIYSPLLGGVHVFKPFDSSCFKWQKLRVTTDYRTTFEDTNSFYRQISSDSTLSGQLAGMYTVGTTLNVKTKSLSSGSSDIKGKSIHVNTFVNASYINQDCYKSSESQLTDDLIKMFDSLTANIKSPFEMKSWLHYETFLQTFGSHFVTKTLFGAVVRQWTFSEASSEYTDKQLNIRACVDFAGMTDVGKLQVGACNGITKEEAESVTHLKTSNYLEIHGGSDETRNRFQRDRKREDLNQLLNEGREMQSPTTYEYMAIWDMLMTKFYNDSTRYTKALNLMNYYHGYKDFGCSYQSAGDQKLRAFEYHKDSTTKFPTFQCTLINKGCHSDGDCQLQGFEAFCYGKSCYDYKDPAFGFRATDVIKRMSLHGQTSDGVNRSCYYIFIAYAACNLNYFDKSVIWDSENLVHLAKLRSDPYKFASPNFRSRHSEL